MSFEFDASVLMDNAAAMFNALFPVFAVVIGLGLGVKLVSFLRGEIGKAF